MQSYLSRSLTVWAMLALPALAQAQEAALSGTVTDTTGATLPGVTVVAVHQASGNSFQAVTNERGDYRLALRVGAYTVRAELPGFQTITRTLELLVNQQAVMNLQMAVGGVQESVTVSGEAPLLDLTSSNLGGNIDPRQMEALPVNGRDWMQLVLMAPGATGNGIFRDPINTPQGSNSSPATTGRDAGNYHVNVDGQQVTVFLSTFQVPYSRDSISEVELVAGRFDATQGRSIGIQINAVTKSGANRAAGFFSGYFRDDRFNAADFVARRVLPYADTQYSATYGGPLVKDKIHIFGSYEYEHEPRTLLFNTQFPKWNGTVTSNHDEKKAGVRVDAQLTSQLQAMVRWNWMDIVLPGSGSATVAPTVNNGRDEDTIQQLFGRMSQVFSSRAVNEIGVGWSTFRQNVGLINNLRNPNAKFSEMNGPQIVLAGLTVGGLERWPTDDIQTIFSIRDDLTLFFDKRGRHTLKLGADYLWNKNTDIRCVFCEGRLIANLRAIPANIESLFPDIWDVTTWNLAPLSSISSSWTQSFVPSPDAYGSYPTRNTIGAWVQDDWAITSRLTLNLGVRYDLQLNIFRNDLIVAPFWLTKRPNEKDNVAPRLGFNFAMNDKTVIRGGGGIYYGTVGTTYAMDQTANVVTLNVPNDGRPDFASNPYNGRTPTYQEIAALSCAPPGSIRPGCTRRDLATGNTHMAPDKKIPYAYQASVGLQRQLSTDIAFQADYAYSGARDYVISQANNLTYNPATGVNYPFSDLTRRALPDWGITSLAFNGGRNNSHSLQTGLTKRFSHRWQASGAYTLSAIWDIDPPVYSGLTEVTLPLAADLTPVYALSVGDQRHRAVASGVWEMPYDIRLSGLYSFGSGERFSTSWAQDLRLRGSGGGGRLRPDGSVIPRNSFVGKPIHRVDLRIDKRLRLGSRLWVSGILEVFNVFNHANFGRYSTNENTPSTYGRPQQASAALAYTPRALQLGFRVGF